MIHFMKLLTTHFQTLPRNACEAILGGGIAQVGTLRLSEAPGDLQKFAGALRASGSADNEGRAV